MENIDEFEQISLETTYTTKLNIIGLPYIFRILTKKNSTPKPPSFYQTPFYYLCESDTVIS